MLFCAFISFRLESSNDVLKQPYQMINPDEQTDCPNSALVIRLPPGGGGGGPLL